MATVANSIIDHDVGTSKIAHWTNSVSDVSGRGVIDVPSALQSSAMGLRVSYPSGSNGITLTKSVSTPGSNQFRVKFAYRNRRTSGGAQTAQFSWLNTGAADTICQAIVESYGNGTTDRVSWQFGDGLGGFVGTGLTNIPATNGSTVCFEMVVIRAVSVTAYINGSQVYTAALTTNTTLYNGGDEFELASASIGVGLGGGGFTDFDEFIADDVAATAICGGTFDTTRSGGRPQHQMVATPDGSALFIAVALTGGDQRIVKMDRPPVGAGAPAMSTVFSPTGGSSIGVLGTQDLDRIYFIGDVTIRHAVSTGSNTNIDPPGAYTLTGRVNPSNADNIIVADYGGYEVYESSDGGDNWTIIGSAIDEPLGMDVVFGDDNTSNTIMIANDTGATNEVLFSPNNRASQTDEASVTIAGAVGIVGLEVSG